MMLRHSASSTKENLTNAAALGAVTRRTARPRATFTNDSQLASHSWPAWEFGTETGSLRLSRVGERERACASQVLTIPSLGSGQPSRGNPRKKKSMYFLKYTGRASVYIHGTVLCLQKRCIISPVRLLTSRAVSPPGSRLFFACKYNRKYLSRRVYPRPYPFLFYCHTLLGLHIPPLTTLSPSPVLPTPLS